ncbi:MAG: peptide chain release factor 1 [bacterium]
MLDKLDSIKKRGDELTELMSDPQVIANRDQYQKCAKEYTDIKDIIKEYGKYRENLNDISKHKEILSNPAEDKDFLELVESEIVDLKAKKEKIEDNLRVLLDPEARDWNKDIIMEIRSGAGGDEASLFAEDLFRMYSKYAEKKGWKIEILSSHTRELGGFKEVVFAVKGKNVYRRLRFESGTHRVQRVPVTETSGRIHTSTVTVAVLPEPEDVEVIINPQELKIDTFRASGAGGQHVNKTDSAVRITHIPTSLVVECQDERSQHKNRVKAMRVLRARLLHKVKEDQRKQISQDRKNQVGTGDRSEKIRTYNFPQARVTNHRINFTSHKLQAFLQGNMDELVEAELSVGLRSSTL